MRFLLGLALGAALILVAVQGGRSLDLDWQGWRSDAMRTVRGWLARVETTGAPPASTADSSPDVAVAAASDASGAAAPEAPAGEPAAAPLTAIPAEQEPAGAAIAPPPDLPALPHSAPGSPEPEAVAPAAADAGAGTDAMASTDAIAGTEPVAGEQPVWAPFHSEMSAHGFAQRLSQALHHPFRVERRGPGRYQVVFGYGDDSERQALLDRAAELTGLPL